ncbi:MAG: hypothetical protein A2V86_15970 [Deltaproteobacteria bacterium RBG_16_49_23]|nr:MAG: hypothetical protein A2V86_15970 [Deltaproteobacteria bacterium RBG_16_49_23]
MFCHSWLDQESSLFSWIPAFAGLRQIPHPPLSEPEALPPGQKPLWGGARAGGLTSPLKGEESREARDDFPPLQPACAKPRLQKPCGGQALRRRQGGDFQKRMSCQLWTP